MRHVPAIWLLVVSATLVWLCGGQAARAASDLDKRLQQEHQELKQLKGQLQGYQTRLERTKRRERTVLQGIEESDRLLQQKSRELQVQERHVKAQAEKYGALTKDMEELTQRLHVREAFLHTRLRALYKQGRLAYLPFLLSAADFSDFLERVRFTTKLVQYDAQLLQQHRNDLAALEQTRRAVKGREEHLAHAKLRVVSKKEEIEKERSKKNKLLTTIRDEQVAYESAMREIEHASIQLLSLITDLERQRKRELERWTRERRQAQTRVPPSPPPVDQRDAAAKGVFARLRGKLSWPLDGKLIVSYGKTKHPVFHTYTFNKGIGISAPPGSDFRVVEAGEVLHADWFKGYGNLLIVDHGDSYYSLYAHAAELLVQVGERVKRQQKVGRTGESGSLQVPALYFEIRHHGKPENPLEWLANHQQ